MTEVLSPPSLCALYSTLQFVWGFFCGATVTASGDLQKLHTCISIVTEVQLYHCLPLVFTRTVNFVPLNRAVFERCSQHVFDTSVC